MLPVPDDQTLTGLGRTQLVTLIRALEADRSELVAALEHRRHEATLFATERAKLIEDLKGIRVRLETVTALVHALLNETKSP